MNHLSTTDNLFFTQGGLDRVRLESLVNDALKGADDGELYLEYSQSERLVWDDGRIKVATFDSSQGFGLRAVSGAAVGYAHAASLDETAIKRAVPTVRSVIALEKNAIFSENPIGTNRQLYSEVNPLGEYPMAEKMKLLADIDQYLRARDPRVKQVMAVLQADWQAVQIIRPDGHRVADVRPLVKMVVQVVVSDGVKEESGYWGSGWRGEWKPHFDQSNWKGLCDRALREALINLSAQEAPSGEMTVVFGAGSSGVLLHEAIGHGLEGDFNRKKVSAFAGLMGQQVAAKGVTILDDGTMANKRGSITIDDEGTPSQATTLIEDGKLVGYIQDRQNARLMNMKSTGNGRRESFAHVPMPRMTNTVMLAGDKSKEEIIASVKKGLYAANFGGGQVEITSGKFVFEVSEGYLIEDGKIGPAVKGAQIIGNGPDVLTRIKMVGNDSELGMETGTCGKNGQQVPVTDGMPTTRIDGLTVGGTAV